MVGTMVGGAIVLRTPMLFALGFIVQFLVGGLSGIYVASPPLDYHVHDSYFVVAHFHYTLLAGSVFGLFAGIYYWWPKVTGRLLFERLGRVHFWLFVVGTNLTFIPQFVLGYDGMPRRVADYSPAYGWAGWNTASTVGRGHRRAVGPRLHRQRRADEPRRQAGRARSVGGPDARVGDDLAAAAPQLHGGAPGHPLPRAAAGPARGGDPVRNAVPVLAWGALLAALAAMLALWTDDLVAVVVCCPARFSSSWSWPWRRRGRATRSSGVVPEASASSPLAAGGARAAGAGRGRRAVGCAHRGGPAGAGDRRGRAGSAGDERRGRPRSPSWSPPGGSTRWARGAYVAGPRGAVAASRRDSPPSGSPCSPSTPAAR